MGAPSNNMSAVASVGLFAAVAATFIRHNKGRSAKSTRTSHVAVPEGVTGRVGRRGAAALAPVLPYLGTFFKCLADPCEPISNPEGYIALCVAENKLPLETLAARLMRPGTVSNAFSDSTVYCYNGFLGLPAAREAAAYFLARRFLSPLERLSMDEALQKVRPEHVALGSGCASLLNHLFFTLAGEGDAVLIPAPYYAAFESDMKMVAGLVCVPVQMTNPVRGPSIKDWKAAAAMAEKKGLHPKIILLTNPNNPLGTVYQSTVVREAIDWARKRKLHTIVDEIYALSVHKKQGHGFESVLQILNSNLCNDVHMLWAVSKDFGSSGFRIGILYTQNALLLASLANLNIFSGVSHPMQLIIAEILVDDEWCDSFLDESRAKITESYEICTNKLNEIKLPYIPAKAGIFVYVDFSSLLPCQTFEGEERFSKLVQEHARVVMTPGQCQRDRKPGMFRICYTWVSPDVLRIAMERIALLVKKIRRHKWDGFVIDPSLLDDVVKVWPSSEGTA